MGMILTGREDPCGLPVRTVAGGRWAVFEVPHTEEGVSDFWGDLPQRAKHGRLWTARDPS